HRLWLAGSIKKEIVCIQSAVPQEIVCVAVKVITARFGYGFDIAARVTTVGCVVEARLHYELLQTVGRRDRDIRSRVRADRICIDAVDTHIVAGRPLAVDADDSVAASELRVV